ncbi:hypothetical protein [Streptomyces sp. AC512_CC834]|nr:hypothetical protein [Streptomyces sp. AC512_CC834]
MVLLPGETSSATSCTGFDVDDDRIVGGRVGVDHRQVGHDQA